MRESGIILIIYGLIGITGALSMLVFAWGFIEYITRIGLPSERRNKGVHIMEWAVGLVITSIVLIGILNLVQRWWGI